MLEIDVHRLVDEYGTYITVLIKQSYQFTLSKDDIDIHMPSLYRPVFSFKWSLNTPNKVYRKQWFILKEALLNKFSYEIVFNWTDGKHCITVDSDALTFTLWADGYGEIHYRIPIGENLSTLLVMLDSIAEIYPDEVLPPIFSYALSDFPVILVSPSQNEFLILECFYTHNNHNKIRIPLLHTHQLLAWLNDHTLDLPPGMTFNTNVLNIQYYDGPFCTSSSIDARIFEKLKSVLTNTP